MLDSNLAGLDSYKQIIRLPNSALENLTLKEQSLKCLWVLAIIYYHLTTALDIKEGIAKYFSYFSMKTYPLCIH